MTRQANIEAMRKEAGFTLIEVVASLVIVGILATFASLFLVVGMEGYETTRKATDAAMNAEVALSRISLELRNIESISSAPVANTSLAYTSTEKPALEGSRVLKFSAGNLYINVDGVDYKLIEDVSAPLLDVKDDVDLDNDGANEVSYITVGFTISNMPAFQVRVYPRAMIDKTW